MIRTVKYTILICLVLVTLTGCMTSAQKSEESIELTTKDMLGTWVGLKMYWINENGEVVGDEDIFMNGVWVEIREDGTLSFHAPDVDITVDWRKVEDEKQTGTRPLVFLILKHLICSNGSGVLKGSAVS